MTLDPFWAPFGIPFWTNCLSKFVLLFGTVFRSFFSWFSTGFGSALASFWMVILATCLDFAKKAQSYETVVNSSRIKGGAPRKTTKKLPKRQRNTGMRTKTKTD